ncbi:DUF2812 domain-containing protein [Peptoniphilus sp. DNF00840]|uniref:DUF2812 domain-containing protein n=1 Tax=Peptoniphilus sp. DNF00840 TaxID=1477000 RepID=UPI000783816A|nr:DUF2812 domain-containing protein [Peptoniphilus sp. DNF00840]KXB69829.1 hypothetical protein HMPREF1864_01267 [Peptoniphilus sp. DNF00840]
MLKSRYLTYTNFGLVEKWYEDMAKKGWQIEKIILPFIHKFKKAEPENVRYKISIAPNEGSFSAFSKDELRDFDKMAEDYGWHLVDRTFNMNIYKLDEGSQDSLYNDGKEEIEILNKGVRGEIISLGINFIVFAFLVLFLSSQFLSSDIFYSNYTIFMGPACLLLILFDALALGDYILFKKRNKDAKDLSQIKFSRLTFSKSYILLLYFPLALMLLALISGFLLSNGDSNPSLMLISFIPALVIISFIYLFRKKIKAMNIKRSKKKFILISMIILIVIFTNVLTFILIDKFSTSNEVESQVVGDFTKTRERKSFLTESCDYYSSEKNKLGIRKTVVKSQDLAENLFERILKNAKNHPYRADYVKDISQKYPYDRTYILSEEKDYLILYKNVVLEVSGNLEDEKVQEDIARILEV